MKQQSQRLGVEKIPKLLLNLSLPAFIGMFVMSLYNVVDTIFIARGVGTIGVAALSIAFPIQMIVGAFAGVFGIGGASIISRALGANMPDKANKIFGHIIWLIAVFSIIIAGSALLFMSPILKMFGATPDILPFAKDYLSIVLLGSVFASFAMATNNVVRSEGNAKMAMLTMMISAGVNIVLDPIFIFGFDMGMQGAALATVIGQLTGAIWLLRYFRSGKSSLTYNWIGWLPEFSIVKEIIAIGLPSFIMMASSSVMVVAANWMLVSYGSETHIAIFGIINRLLAFFVMPMNGVVQGMQPIIGYNYGAGFNQRVSSTIKLGIIITTTISISSWLIVHLIPDLLMNVFSTDPDVIISGADALKVIFLAAPVIGFQMVAGGLYQALGKAKTSFVLSISRQILLLIPMILVLPHFYGLIGVWVAFPIADGLAFLLSLLIVLKDRQILFSQPKVTSQAI